MYNKVFKSLSSGSSFLFPKFAGFLCKWSFSYFCITKKRNIQKVWTLLYIYRLQFSRQNSKVDPNGERKNKITDSGFLVFLVYFQRYSTILERKKRIWRMEIHCFALRVMLATYWLTARSSIKHPTLLRIIRLKLEVACGGNRQRRWLEIRFISCTTASTGWI